MHFGRHIAVCVAAVTLLVGAPAIADISDIVFEIQATNAQGTATFQVPLTAGSGNSDYYSWSSNQTIELRDGQELIGSLASGRVDVFSDPAISLNFSMQAGTTPTTFTVKSALLSFPTVTGASGRASAGINLTDFDGDGASLTALAPLTGAYLANYNGFVPGGATFANMIAQISVDGINNPFGTSTGGGMQPAVGYMPIGAPVSNISTQISFMVSANDLASGTSVFEVIPEPTSVLLLAAGLVLVARRRS
jgi:hypothetical protein